MVTLQQDNEVSTFEFLLHAFDDVVSLQHLESTAAAAWLHGPDAAQERWTNLSVCLL
jgi:hypothetical protein